MNELIRTLLFVGLGAAALVVVLAVVAVLVVRARHGSLRQGVDAWFRRPPKTPKMAGKEHYYIPYWQAK